MKTCLSCILMLVSDNGIAVAAVVYQCDGEYQVICYTKRTLKGAEKNYFTLKKEILFMP